MDKLIDFIIFKSKKKLFWSVVIYIYLYVNNLRLGLLVFFLVIVWYIVYKLFSLCKVMGGGVVKRN